MSGIFPTYGVDPASTANAVDVPTTCDPADLFYSVGTCKPRFDPAAMNAMMSELLNVVDAAGRIYDCSTLNNLALAIIALAGIQDAQPNTLHPAGIIVRSSDGDLFWNCSGTDILTSADVTTAGLEASGFCRLNTYAETATAAGTDSFGYNYLAGQEVLHFPNGDTLALGHPIYLKASDYPADTNDEQAITAAYAKQLYDALSPCDAPSATPAEITAMTGDETVTVCIGGVPKSVAISDLPVGGAASSFPTPIPKTYTIVGMGGWAPTGATITVTVPAGITHMWSSYYVAAGGTFPATTRFRYIHAVTPGDVITVRSATGGGVGASIRINGVAISDADALIGAVYAPIASPHQIAIDGPTRDDYTPIAGDFATFEGGYRQNSAVVWITPTM